MTIDETRRLEPRRTGQGCFKTAGIVGVCLATTPPAITAIIAGAMARGGDNPTATLIAVAAGAIAVATSVGLSILVRRAIRKNAALYENPSNKQ